MGKRGAGLSARGPAFQRVQPAESRLRARKPAPQLYTGSLLHSIHDSHRAAPARARSLDLHGEARDRESMRPRQQVEIRQLLDLAILARDPGKVRGPDVA